MLKYVHVGNAFPFPRNREWLTNLLATVRCCLPRKITVILIRWSPWWIPEEGARDGAGRVDQMKQKIVVSIGLAESTRIILIVN